MSFLHALDASVRRAPHAVALRSGGAALTYAELERRTASLASHLAAKGSGPECTIGVALPRSIELVIAIVGVLKSGAAYLPLDPKYPSARLRHCIDDAGARLILTTSEQGELLSGHVERVALDDLACVGGLGCADGVASVAASARAWAWEDRAAYVIYTSGSTGLPKGVVVSDRALSTFIEAATTRRWIVPGDRLLALTTVAFDISILELLVPLCHGCEVVVADVDSARDPHEVARLIARHQPTVVQATPSQWRAIVHQHPDALQDVRVLVGGEPLPRDLAAMLVRASAGVTNLYGPTEATVWASSASVSSDDLAATAPAIVRVGGALPGYALSVIDTDDVGETPPDGTGEIAIAGSGLARGYRRKPALTAERFIPHPHDPGARMYRTGDVATRRADGEIAFLGRNDRQVKIRGHRIELEEIEAALRSHDACLEAVVTAQPEEQRILAYVICKKDEGPRTSTQLSAWQGVWNAAYAPAADAPADFNIAGWQNSYTSEPMAAEEMRAWVDETVGTVRRLRPSRVLEIGCGTGLLLMRLAPDCESYVGVDFSAEALAFVERQIAADPAFANVRLQQAAAHELAFQADGSCDLVILNSVVQYFPHAAYLRAVLAEAARIVGPGRRIFVGDVRNQALAEAFHTAVQLHRAPDDLPVSKLRERIDVAMARETELLLAPAFFDTLIAADIGIAAADLRIKTGGYDNELTQFRYDVVLTAGSSPRSLGEPAQWIEGDSGGRWQHRAQAALDAAPGLRLGVRGVMHRRVARAMVAVRLVAEGELPTAGAIRRVSALVDVDSGDDAETIVRLADAFGASVSFGGVDAAGRYDVYFNPLWQAGLPRSVRGGLRASAQASVQTSVLAAGRASVGASVQASALASDPAASHGSHLTAALRQHLAAALPPYMVPAAIVELDRLPLTANGKLDRAALPVPTFANASSYEAPRSPEEEALCELFQEVLRSGVVGIHDNFFELGGHSLAAAGLASMIQARFGVAVSIHALFEAPTAARLAAYVREGRRRHTTDHVVTLRAQGTLPPLFCLPPVYGLSFAYAGLARELRPERPIHCLQALGIREGEDFAATLEEAAHHAVMSIRANAPRGPYHLFGWSFGGLMAYAVACLLQRQGQRVGQLVVIDAYPRAISATGRLGSVSKYLDGFREHLEDAVREEIDGMRIDRLLRLSINHAMFMSAFRPETFDGDMLLVTARENRDLPALWEPFVRGTIETCPIACSHMDMMTLENLRTIASLVEAHAARLADPLRLTAPAHHASARGPVAARAVPRAVARA